jgi:hypothetical protein
MISQLHQVLIGFSDWKEICIGQSGFMDFILRSVFTTNSRLAKVGKEMFAARPRVYAALRGKNKKEAVNLSVHEDDGRPTTWILGNTEHRNWYL